MSIIDGLRRAESDDRVKGVLIRLPEEGMEPGMADELRLAIKHFRTSGKPVIAHSQGLYPSGVVTSTYMLGAAADELWMQPGASFQVTGLANEDIFFKRFFDKYGVKADYEQRYEFKNAVNGYLYDDYTPAPSRGGAVVAGVGLRDGPGPGRGRPQARSGDPAPRYRGRPPIWRKRRCA